MVAVLLLREMEGRPDVVCDADKAIAQQPATVADNCRAGLGLGVRKLGAAAKGSSEVSNTQEDD